MNRPEYKGIVFAPGYNASLAEFKKEFGSTHVFNNIPEEEREAELKKAHKIATTHAGEKVKDLPANTEK